MNSSLLPHFSLCNGPSLQSKQPSTVRKFRSKVLKARPFLIIFIASLNLLCWAISSDLINSLQRVCHIQSLTDVWFQALWSQSSGPFLSMRRPLALQSYALLCQEGFHFDDAVLLENLLWSCLGQFLCLHPLAMSHIFLLICLVSFCIDPDGLYTRIALSPVENIFWLLDSTRVCNAPLGLGCKNPLLCVQLSSESRFHFVLSLSMI